jgi:hypothetical protein
VLGEANIVGILSSIRFAVVGRSRAAWVCLTI